MGRPPRHPPAANLVLRLSAVLSSMAACGLLSSSHAGDILRGGAPAASNRRPGAQTTSAAQAAQARANARDALARTSRALQSVQAAQAAARSYAAQARNAGADPNHPGIILPDVPDGLGPGGLQVHPGAIGNPALWTGADFPVQSSDGGRVNVTVKQTAQQAVLNWETFNVGSNTSLNFDQSAGGTSVGQWIAFNQVSDPSGRPSQILGAINAPGQVYVINQNGIIFGGGSQVNVHTLVASSLPINNNLINRGLLNQSSTAQFLFSALPQTGDVPFTPPPPPATGKIGDVIVQPGAILSAPTTEASVGGRIALVGANVANHGTILTPDGQTILAAGLQVGFTAHASSDASLRGLDTYVGETGTYAGSAANHGLIEALRGSATITGREVGQFGAIESSTSVSLNGRIDLRAEFDAIPNAKYDPVGRPTFPAFFYGGGSSAANTGTVTFGPDSVTRVLPEWGSEDKVTGTELALRSQVNARGSIVHLGKGGMIHAPSGKVDFTTGTWDFAAGTDPSTSFVRSGGQIYIDNDAMINVAGTPDAFSPLSNHILKVTLRASELADSPLQRGTFFRGGEITVDLRRTGIFNGREWVGTPLADLRGYLNVIERTVDELTVAGGSVSLNSGGSIVVREGSVIDTSAGWLNYGSGMVKTTRILYKGRLFEIADATPDRLYDGIYTGEFVDRHPTWGVQHIYRVPWMTGEHFEQEYLHGANAGGLNLAGSSVALDGTLLARAVSGPRQNSLPAAGGALSLDFEVQKLVPGVGEDRLFSPTPPSVTFDEHPSQHPAGPFGTDASGAPLPLRDDRVAKVVLSPALLSQEGSGYASLTIRNPDGNITVPHGVNLTAPPRGSIKLEAANITVHGDVIAPGGSLAFATYNISPSAAADLLNAGAGAVRPPPDPARGLFQLSSGASLSTAGLVIDQRRVDSPSFSAPLVTDGGSISIKTYSANLAGGGLIDVSGGVIAGPRGGFTYGKAGSIEILTGQDLSLSAVTGGYLHLDSTLKGYSGTTTGGTLSLQAQLIQIGGHLLHPLSLRLTPDFFNEGGFSTFNLTGLGALAPADSEDEFLPAVSVADGTKVAPRVLGWLAVPFGGPGGELQLIPFERPEGLRAPVNLNLIGKGVKDELAGGAIVYRGDVVSGRGSSLTTDALGSIRLTGETVAIYGSLTAPAGRITVSGGSSFISLGSPPNFAQATVYLAPSARLSATGAVLTQRDRFGRRTGSVLPGGSISVSGNIVAEAGAVLDVSGTSGILDLHPLQLGRDAFGNVLMPDDRLVPFMSGLTMPLFQGLSIPTRLDSNGGSIQLSGAQMLFTDATLLGHAGGPNAMGGTLSVSSGKYRVPGIDFNTAESNLVVTQSGRSIPVSFAATGRSAIGQPVRDAGGNVIPGMGYFAADTFAQGGFSSLGLGGNVEFRGPVTIHADNALRVGTGGVIRADGPVNLFAHYAALGRPFVSPVLPGTVEDLFTQSIGGSAPTPYFFLPTAGPGSISVTADHIDVGTLSMQGIGVTSLTARNGDIRGNGTLQVAGRLNLTAAQIYPTTGTAFNILAYDGAGAPGSIHIERSGSADIPMSAAGTLNIFAGEIYQGGVLRAPFGAIQLGWDGTGTAPFVNPVAGSAAALPVTNNLTLAPGSETSVAAVDPVTGRGVLIPYGIVEGGQSWIAPSGLDITALGPPEKRINLGAKNLATLPGSLIDIRGGGELFAYRFVPGTGGSQDVLSSSGSYAIIPGFDSEFSPYAPFGSAAVFDGDTGYRNDTISPGDQIYLGPNHGLPAGNYTLLPARYALLPGAYLITPVSGSPVGSFAMPDGSYIVSGYRYNNLNPGTDSMVQRRWELAPGSVVRQRSQYEEYTGSSFFATAAEALNLKTPRLPQDSGRLILQATEGLSLAGNILAKPIGDGRGALVDISSPLGIVIGGPGVTAPAGSLLLAVDQLNAISAESLLVGGIRSISSAGTTVTVNTGNLTLDNAMQALTGSDIILVAKNGLTLADGSIIEATGGTGDPDVLNFGSATAGSGNGLMVRASGDAGATSNRTGVTPGGAALLTVGSGARLSGGGITLDSTAGTSLSSNAFLDANTINLSSGQVSIQLNNPGPLLPGNGLVLAGQALASLEQNATNLNLLSYTSLDLYGTGNLTAPGSLRLSAGEIRGFNQAGGAFTIESSQITLDNRAASTAPGVLPSASGELVLNADRIVLGAGDLKADQFTNVTFNARSGLAVSGKGSLLVQNSVSGSLSGIVAEQGANYALRAGGAMNFTQAADGLAPATTLGGVLLLEGASVNLGADVLFPSGSVTVRSTAGNLNLAGRILAGGTRQSLHDLVRFTNGGEIILQANGGSLNLADGSVVDVSADAGGGDAGLVKLAAPAGTINLAGSLRGAGNAAGMAGSIEIDVSTLPSLSQYAEALNNGGFFASRTFRARNGDVLVDGSNRARSFSLTADQGSITVSGVIDASGVTGGSIALVANRNLTALSGSRLTVAAQQFNSAGKGGSIRLEAGAQTGGVIPAGALLDLQTGSTLDLSVASLVAGSATTPGSSAFNGRFSGTLHLRAPQNAAGTDLGIAQLNSGITGASSILAEGYRLYDLTASGGAITTAVQNSIKADGTTFGNSVDAMTARLLPGGLADPLAAAFVLAPGAEIINRTGDLTLGTTSSTAAADWDLATYRFGPKSAPGVLTLRAAGDLVFLNSLTDGFSATPETFGQWLAPLMAQNPLLPVNAQSWSYRLTAGADLSGAASGTTLDLSALASGKGSLRLGKNYTNASFVSGGSGLTANALSNGNRLQVIRTGSGGIDIAAGRDVRIMNVFASVYSAGTQVADRRTIYAPNDFSPPIVDTNSPLNTNGTLTLGNLQQLYPAQYAMAGGNVNIRAGADIARYTSNAAGVILIDDASRQLPANWLYRRGFIDPATGEFGATGVTSGQSLTDPSASTTWWVDYSNFFQGIGALGGGNIVITAGNDVRNVDAVVPTNARAPGGVPDPSRFLELGGGDVTVQAGADILGGTYYVERGLGTLKAGGSITLEATKVGNADSYNPRSPSRGIIRSLVDPEVTSPDAWIPTMLFLGRGGFDLQARSDILLGPVANAFLEAPGIGNRFYYKTYFSTYGPDSYVNVSSLSGDITHRLSVTLPNESGPIPALQAWMKSQNLLSPAGSGNPSASFTQPWLRLSDVSVEPFTTSAALMPGSLRSTALAGDINIAGRMLLSPAAHGTLEIAAAGALNGLNRTGSSNFIVQGASTNVWGAASINLSDANPASIPGPLSPLTYHNFTERNATTGLPTLVSATQSPASFMAALNALFNESGSYQGEFGVTQTKQALHAPGILHANDPDPLRIYALGGDISGLTLFSPKAARVLAGRDITDIALYLQNTAENDVSVVAAGRDLLPYNPSSLLRSAISAPGNLLARDQRPLPGDLQVAGSGALEILAGRKLVLGTTPALLDGTGDGISSIGNLRNPFLPSRGADLVLAAGIGPATSLADSKIDFDSFISTYVQGGEGQKYLAELGVSDFDSRTKDDQARIALEVFYLILRDAGRNFATAGNYDTGTAAVESLFGSAAGNGSIDLSSRSVKTRNGGDISMIAPGGGLTLGTNLGSSVVPPGVITESGGNISIFTKDSVDVGVLRIFTLRGGNIMIWSSEGDVAAGSSSKTVAAAPPTRVLIDPQSADVATDLAGLATGGGIGVLATVKNVEPGDVDLIAPNGAVDAGEAGIRSAGNLTIAAAQVLNASNIAVAGTSAGAPSVAVSAPTVVAPSPAPAPVQAPSKPGDTGTKPLTPAQTVTPPPPPLPSEFVIKVLSYGGPAGSDEDEEEKRRRREAEEAEKSKETEPEPAPEQPGPGPR